METIDTGLKRTRIKGEDDMNVDQPPEPPVSRAIEAKRRALSRFVRHASYSIIFHETKEYNRVDHRRSRLSVCKRPSKLSNELMLKTWKDDNAWKRRRDGWGPQSKERRDRREKHESGRSCECKPTT